MAHEHCHHHNHGHHHHHHDIPSDLTPQALKRIRLAFFMNLIFGVVELVGGLLTHSLAIQSGAIHDLGDSLAIGVALYLEKKSHQNVDQQYSYGYRRYSPLAAVITGGVILTGAVAVLIQVVPHLLQPEMPKTEGMFAFACMGLLINASAAFRTSKGSSLNEKMITWHLIEDTMSWVAVLVSSIILHFVNWPILDSLLALAISVWVVVNVWRNLRSAVNVFMQAKPSEISEVEVKNFIESLEGVHNFHHMHLWSLDGEKHILTVHLVLEHAADLSRMSKIKHELKKGLRQKFNIVEATIEIELHDENCEDPSHSV